MVTASICNLRISRAPLARTCFLFTQYHSLKERVNMHTNKILIVLQNEQNAEVIHTRKKLGTNKVNVTLQL